MRTTAALLALLALPLLCCVRPIRSGAPTDPDAAYVRGLMRQAVVVRAAAVFVGPGGLPKTVGAQGSGVVVAHRHGHSLVLTARHVCENGDTAEVDGVDYSIPLWTFFIIDGDLARHPAVVVSEGAAPEDDSCLLDVEGTVGDVAELAETMPPVGAMVTHVSAPFQNYDYGMMYVSDGRFCGVQRLGEALDRPYSTYSIPSSHGGSGGGVWYRGQVIGIIVLVNERFSSVTQGVHLLHLRADLREALKKWYPTASTSPAGKR